MQASSQKTILVLGLGLSGQATIGYLKDKYNLILADTRETFTGKAELAHKYPDLPLYAGQLPDTLIKLVDEVVISPGISLKHPFVQKIIQAQLPVYGDVEIFAKRYSEIKPTGKLACITGSNGKSTVTTWLGFVCEKLGLDVSIGGNIGTPVLELLSQPTEYVILELSSFQLDTTFSLKDHVSCILNVTPDHLDRYDSFEHYAQSKQTIFKNAKSQVFNAEDVLTKPVAEYAIEKQLCFSCSEAKHGFGLTHTDLGHVITLHGKPLLNINQLSLKGLHNAANAMVVLAVMAELGIDIETALKPLCEFSGLPHRCQAVGQINGIDFVNDSKATNIGSTEAALHGLGPTLDHAGIHLIMGGEAKGATFEGLTSIVNQYCASVHLIGADASIIEETLNTTVPLFTHASLQAAAQAAFEKAQQHEMVLLSPGCASFDMFKGFADRGEKFIQCYEAMAS